LPLDVSFGEAAARNHKDNGTANIAVICRRTLDVARLDKSTSGLE
jgi:predicted transposase YbfD/YdcC